MNPADLRFASREAALEARLRALPDPQQRLSWVVDQARRRDPFPAAERTEERRVPGCAARLWMRTEGHGDTCRFACDSDSAILKAVAGLLCDLYDGLPAPEVASGEPVVLERTGLLALLTENRRQTVGRVRAVIREFAAARLTLVTRPDRGTSGEAPHALH